MATLAVLSMAQQGGVGGPGVSRFHIAGAGGADVDQTMINAAATHLQTLYQQVATLVDQNVIYRLESTGNVITTESGLFQREYTIGPGIADIPGTQFAQPRVAGTGARVQWVTQTLSTRRVMRGGTFFVPLYGGAFDNSGDLAANTLNVLLAACNTFLAGTAQFSSELHVYHHPAKGAITGGKSGKVIATKMSQVPAFLKSRRT